MNRKISDKFATDDFRLDSIELNQEDGNVNVESEFYCDVYKELVEIVGAATTKKLWKHYHGLTIQFPQRLYSKRCWEARATEPRQPFGIRICPR